MNMTFTVNGVNMLPYIAYQGLKWQRSDVEAPDAGRTLDGLLHRGRVATKIRLDVTCRPLTSSEASTVLSAILPEFVSVTYTDPMAGGTVTKTMYSNNNPASFLMRKRDGTEWWSGITFPLVER
jgi:hypothetical protein